MFARRATLVLAAAALVTPALTVPAAAATSAKPGLVSKVVLQDTAAFSGYDAATDGAGNTYLGWIGDDAHPGSDANRRVYLCTLPPGSNSCLNGIQSIASLDVSGSAGLRVLATRGGLVTMVWYHETQTPLYNGRDGRIAVATSQSGGPLTAATDVADGVSYGELLDAELGPGGALWTVTAQGAGTNSIEVREGVQNPAIPLATPFSPGAGKLAFAGTTPIVVIDSYGTISTPPVFATGTGSGFTGWTSVAKTWTAGAHFGLVATKSGVRLVTSIDNASYWPTVLRWTGTGFSPRRPTGDKNNCSAFSHDLGTDTSGRLVDAEIECEQVAVTDAPNTAGVGIVRFPTGGTPAGGDPQIASTSRGHAVVMWSIESSVGNRLYFGRVNLPGFDTVVGKRSPGGSVRLTGPTSCQPASTIPVAVHGSPALGWKVSAASLKLGSTKLATKTVLNGAALTPNKVYTLTGTVTFAKGVHVVTASAVLRFRSCANP